METRGPDKPTDVPKGMLMFRVVGTEICDSTDTYCAPGEWAVLTKELATHYQELGFIKAALPEDFGGNDNGGGDDKAQAAAGADQGKAKQ